MKRIALLSFVLIAAACFAKTPQSITFNGTNSDQTVGSTYKVSATASSGLPVTITPVDPKICTLTTAVAPGDCVLRATQSGNSVFAPATPVNFHITVTAAVTLKTWNLRSDGSWTAQYDPKVWKEVRDDASVDNDAFAPSMLMPADDTQFVAIRATFGGGDATTFKDHTEDYVQSLKGRDGIMILQVGGADLGDTGAAIFVAYIQEAPDNQHIAFTVMDWILPGEKNNVDSHSGMLVEGLSPAASKDDSWFEKTQTVVNTIKRNVVVHSN